MLMNAPLARGGSVPSSSSSSIPTAVNEEDLPKELRGLLQNVTRREPLETTYRYLLMNGVVTPRKPILPKDKIYTRHMSSRLRERVEKFGTQHEWDRIAQRQLFQGPVWEEGSLRAAFTLREPKKHEQEALLQATLASQNTPKVMSRRHHVESMAQGLQAKELKVLKQQEEARQQAQAKLKQQQEEERLVRLEEQQRARESSRRRREEEEEEEEREEERRRQREAQATPRHRLSEYLMPAFEKLWFMEFPNIGNTNPFRIVIDKTNCAAMGVADYCDIVKEPMNLTWIQQKLKNAEYETVPAFFHDVELVIQNALLYNSDPNNDYHLAAKEMNERYKKLRRYIIADLKKKRSKTM